MTAEVLEVNPALASNPELVNKDPYGEGWMVKIKLLDKSQAAALLSADQYEQLLG
jgi:glycine cleavage system H protein